MPRKPVETLPDETVRDRLATELPGWALIDGWLRRSYRTAGWSHTLMVTNHVAFLAEAADHHPDLGIGWNRVEVRLRTHQPDGITEKDLELARRIEGSVLWRPDPHSAFDGPPDPFVEAQPSS